MSSIPSMVSLPVRIDNSDLHAVRVVGTNLLDRMVIVWQRGKAKVNRLLRNASPETSIAYESTCRFPYEIVEVIISYLIHDLDALPGIRDLRYFSAFTNIRSLRIKNLEIYRFIPGIERYFEHFSPSILEEGRLFRYVFYDK